MPTSKDHAAYMRRYYAVGKERGLCYHCRAPLAVDSASYCAEHAAKSRETNRERYWRYRAEGRCGKCGRDAGGQALCAAHKTPTNKFRRTILERDERRCHWCGGEADTIDRLVAGVDGGRYTGANSVASCRSCNSSRHRHYERPPLLAALGKE